MNTERMAGAMLALACTVGLLSACGNGGGSSAVAKADATRAPVSEAGRADAKTLASDSSAFAWDLYRSLARPGENLFISPFSISEAMAMVYAGARGDTATEMERVLGFGAFKDRVHPAFNALEQGLTGPAQKQKETEAFRLSIANAAWAQAGHPFEQPYLETLAVNYGSGVRLADFAKEPESARRAVNDWVSDQTAKRITDLLPQGSVTPMTRLVLANAIYFKADWALPFDGRTTTKQPFKLLGGGTVEADMMAQHDQFGYARSGDMEAVELLYAGERVSMVVILPAEGRFEAAEASLDGKTVGALLAGLKKSQMSLSVPRFSFASTFSLKQALAGLGIKSAFEPGLADFSGMDGTRELFIQGAYHKAFVKVDEKGTEAAAATGVVAGVTSAPLLSFRVDRPFFFVVRDRETGTVLFLGRVLDPTK